MILLILLEKIQSNTSNPIFKAKLETVHSQNYVFPFKMIVNAK